MLSATGARQFLRWPLNYGEPASLTQDALSQMPFYLGAGKASQQWQPIRYQTASRLSLLVFPVQRLVIRGKVRGAPWRLGKRFAGCRSDVDPA